MAGYNRELNYFQKLVGVIIISIVVLVFFAKINRLAVATEQESIQQTLSVIRSGIQIYSLNAVMTGRSSDLASYENANPVSMMRSPPLNYAGEYAANKSIQVPEGSWYFDTTNKELVYEALNDDVFGKELRYRLDFQVRNKSSATASGLRLIVAGRH